MIAIRHNPKVYGAIVVLGCILFVGFSRQSLLVANEPSTSMPPNPTAEEHAYMVVGFTCGLTCDSCKQNCDSAQAIKNLRESLARDLVAALRRQMKYTDDLKIGQLNIAYDDAADKHCSDKSCDRLSIDLGSQELVILCKSKEQHIPAFSETNGRCPFAASKKISCFKLMISNFAQQIEQHNHTFHILGIRGK
jgi:hypothetical protein